MFRIGIDMSESPRLIQGLKPAAVMFNIDTVKSPESIRASKSAAKTFNVDTVELPKSSRSRKSTGIVVDIATVESQKSSRTSNQIQVMEVDSQLTQTCSSTLVKPSINFEVNSSLSPVRRVSREFDKTIAFESAKSTKSNILVIPTISPSQKKSASPPTNFSLNTSYSPIRKSQGLRGRLESEHKMQSRRSKTRMKIVVDPQNVRFICGINRFSDVNYDYMIRVNEGHANLSELLGPVKLHIYACDVSPISSFQRQVLVGEAKYDEQPQLQSSSSLHHKRNSLNNTLILA